MCKVFLLIIVEYISYISPSQNETKVIKVCKKYSEKLVLPLFVHNLLKFSQGEYLVVKYG